MKRRASSSESGSRGGLQDGVENIRTKPPHIYDNITRRLLQLGITLAITTFVGLIVRYAVQEFDPSVNTITVTTSRVNNRDVASLSVSKNFLERILEFIEESISIVAAIIPIGFPLCTIFNRHFAKIRAGSKRFEMKDHRVLSMIPKYVVIGDTQVCLMPNSTRLRPLVRDTIYHLIKAQLKPKLIVEESLDDARKLGIRIGLIKRDHHKLAVIRSVDLLKNITDSRGDIKQGKVRYLLSRMKIMSQSTPADKSLLIYLIKHCESMPNENLAYVGYSFTDPEAMKLADCSITFQDCDDDDVKRAAQLIVKSELGSFTDIYLFVIVCLITSNITQAYALYQISASVSCCIYRFLSITVFQEQLISHSQFSLLILLQQLFAIFALMTKWLSSLPTSPLQSVPIGAEMSQTDESHIHSSDSNGGETNRRHSKHHHRSATTSISGNGIETVSLSLQRSRDMNQSSENETNYHHHHHHNQAAVASSAIPMQTFGGRERDDTLGSSSSLEAHDNHGNGSTLDEGEDEVDYMDDDTNGDDGSKPARNKRKRRSKSRADKSSDNDPYTSRHSTPSRARPMSSSGHHHHHQHHHHEQPIHLSGTDLDLAIINSKLATSYKQTFRNSTLVDDVTYRLAKLHIAYQVLVMIIIMIFGNAMFQLNMNNNKQHQTLAFNSLIMNNIFTLASCFNQFGAFNLRSGFRNHPFFVCVLLMAVGLQVCLTELNAFGLENLNPLQWFVCFVFALLSALIAPLTGQQARRRPDPAGNGLISAHQLRQQHLQKQQHQQYLKPTSAAAFVTAQNPSPRHHHHQRPSRVSTSSPSKAHNAPRHSRVSEKDTHQHQHQNYDTNEDDNDYD